MKLKLSLVSMLAVAFAATFAAQASASTEYHFLHNGEPITGEPTLIFTGPASFENEWGGFECGSVDAEVKFTTSEAHITGVVPTECETTGLWPVFGCELGANAPTPTAIPWTATPVSQSQATLSGVSLDLPMESGCAFGENIAVEGNELTLNAVTAGKLGKVTLGGSLETPLGPLAAEGTLSPENEGTITLVST